MVPADQRFLTGDGLGGQIHHRLVVDGELALLQAGADLGLKAHALHQGMVDAGVIKLQGLGIAVLSFVERGLGLLVEKVSPTSCSTLMLIPPQSRTERSPSS